jgi:hypothetical protein
MGSAARSLGFFSFAYLPRLAHLSSHTGRLAARLEFVSAQAVVVVGGLPAPWADLIAHASFIIRSNRLVHCSPGLIHIAGKLVPNYARVMFWSCFRVLQDFCRKGTQNFDMVGRDSVEP